MNQFTRKRLSILLLSSALSVLVSCDKFKGDQTIPSYIHIEKISFTTTDTQGTASSKITDAWVYADGELIGAFELPVTLPILKEGKHKLMIQAGIKMNGIASTRIYYPFYKPAEYEVTLYRDSVITLSPSVIYYDNVKFVWMESFENGGSSLEKTSKSDTSLVLTSDHQLVFEGTYSGLINMGDSVLLFEAATMNSYSLPKNGASIFLEMNYKTNNPLTVGVMGIGASQTFQEPCMVLNPTETWKKIYINLTPTVDEMTTALEFKIFIGAVKSEDVDQAQILVDNFKLLRFQ
ncbi:MAG: hypothetical protein NTU44_14605 [Bacteroidetes bacterium]|nr:hypothetical protein [Bacteroidota bacterium]